MRSVPPPFVLNGRPAPTSGPVPFLISISLTLQIAIPVLIRFLINSKIRPCILGNVCCPFESMLQSLPPVTSGQSEQEDFDKDFDNDFDKDK
ncbi:hypothetical protein EVAR_85460_1 [Eumeta japonica]|uniref:Uncharacterized protein n=1 Tax=Eumeta variegata TaxID=151549 RepID=A0A4C1VC66_EUMVA|nr:hypothetical protein EVAR_85460_1 [Eumeta japonica]